MLNFTQLRYNYTRIFFVSRQDMWLPPELRAAVYQNPPRRLHCADNTRSWGSRGFLVHQPQLPAPWPRHNVSLDAATVPSHHLTIDFPTPVLYTCIYLLNNMLVRPLQAESTFPNRLNCPANSSSALPSESSPGSIWIYIHADE